MSLVSVFRTLPELLGETELCQAFFQSYAEVFNAEWGENWSVDQVRNKYEDFARTDGAACRVSLVLNSDQISILAGFCVTVSEKLQITLQARDLPPKLNSESDLRAVLNAFQEFGLSNETQVLLFREIAIIPQFRRGVAIFQMLPTPHLQHAEQQHIDDYWFWTAEHSNMAVLARGLEMRKVYQYNDDKRHAVYVGDVKKMLTASRLGWNELTSAIKKGLRPRE